MCINSPWSSLLFDTNQQGTRYCGGNLENAQSVKLSRLVCVKCPVPNEVRKEFYLDAITNYTNEPERYSKLFIV